MMQQDVQRIARALERIADAAERNSPRPPEPPDLDATDAPDAYLWLAAERCLSPVREVSRVPLNVLKGIDRQAGMLLANTSQFAQGRPANNALLWGARGMGKSSLVKAVHDDVNQKHQARLALIEIHREDIATLPALLKLLRDVKRRCLLFCDDLSFEEQEAGYKSLKAVLEGGIEGRPQNVLFYATSNRRHLMPRHMAENVDQDAIHPSEAVEEKVSLSDRFGLWLGFHPCDQDTFLGMIDAYADSFGITLPREEIHRAALEWSVTRGARSGRVAWQFMQDLAGQHPPPTKLSQQPNGTAG